ncbi:protein kinase domain-containing protein [Catenulispora pinisilvae]|uniref:protein kinase domain-containing protein n=1 Tax=Catenulispora pinisilvae TaxID=2705253 RepID=UPI001890F7C5|nr:protein kinase [Catenulispora pinisilvae]
MGRPEEAVASEGPLAEFARDLRALRHATGQIPYRDLGRLARYSPSALSTAVSGRKLPTIELTLAFVRACGGTADDVRTWEQRWHEVNESLGRPGRAPRRPPPTSLTRRFADADPANARNVVQFVGQMHKLKIGSGQLTLRDIERRARDAGQSLPTSTLCDALKGDRLPQWRVVEAFVIACGDEEALDRWHEAWTRLAMATVTPHPETGLYTVSRRIAPPDQPVSHGPTSGTRTPAAGLPAVQRLSASPKRSATDRRGELESLEDGAPRNIGPYRLLGHLGSGGMSRVYLGVDESGKQAAVKVMRRELADDKEFLQRFQREVGMLHRVPAGASFARVLAADPEARRPWLATEYVPGPSLAEVVAGDGPLSPAAVRRLGADLAAALATVHELGLVHRDVKPGNILMAEQGPKLIDFGIARDDSAATITQTGIAFGTPGYIAPEQISGEREIGPPADVFALGAVLAFAATGRHPFGEGNVTALIYRMMFEKPDLDAIPAELREVIARCMSKGPHERPSAGEVAAILAVELAPPEDMSVHSGGEATPTIAIPPTSEQPASEQPTRRNWAAPIKAAQTLLHIKLPPRQ